MPSSTLEMCHRCGRRTAFRFWSWADVDPGEVFKSAKTIVVNGTTAQLTERVAFCTWYCANAHHQVTGKPVENDKGQIVIEATI